MKIDEFPDVVKARELFSKYSRTTDHKLRISYFDEALDLLSLYIRDDSDEGRLARNIQNAHTRELLKELPSIGAEKLEFMDWHSYFSILVHRLDSNARALRAEDPALETNWYNFKQLYARDALSMLREAGYLEDEEQK
jgi:hypothetical protein